MIYRINYIMDYIMNYTMNSIMNSILNSTKNSVLHSIRNSIMNSENDLPSKWWWDNVCHNILYVSYPLVSFLNLDKNKLICR